MLQGFRWVWKRTHQDNCVTTFRAALLFLVLQRPLRHHLREQSRKKTCTRCISTFPCWSDLSLTTANVMSQGISASRGNVLVKASTTRTSHYFTEASPMECRLARSTFLNLPFLSKSNHLCQFRQFFVSDFGMIFCLAMNWSIQVLIAMELQASRKVDVIRSKYG